MNKKGFWEASKNWWTHKNQIQIPDAYDRIKQDDLLPGDILLFYHGNKLTQAHGQWMRSTKYGHVSNAPYHAAIVYDRTMSGCIIILDPETQTTYSSISEYTEKEGIRIDIIRFETLPEIRTRIQNLIQDIAEREGFYDVWGYGSFIAQLPYLGWVSKFIKPSKKNFFCSDAVTYVCHQNYVQVSPLGNDFTAPVDLLIYGLQNHKLYTLKKRGESDADTK